MLRSMNEEQTIEILAHFWNNAGGQTRLSLMKRLFDGYPPPRLTSIEELMKLNYPIKKITQQAAQFLELFDNYRSEKEQLHELEANAWPKLSDKKQKYVSEFLQLSTSERSLLREMSRAMTHPIVEGNVFDTGAIEILNSYYDPCDKGQVCETEAPTCQSYQGKYVCLKPCVGDPNCFAFEDPSNKRSWPGKCKLDQKVCEGFSYYDDNPDKNKPTPFGGKATDAGNGWGASNAGIWSGSFSHANHQSLLQIFSFILPIFLVLCINF